MEVYAKIDIGRVRESNQDAYGTSVLPDGNIFAVVCDGMGGANAGNVASDCAVKWIREYVENGYRAGMPADRISKLLCSAIANANIAVYDLSLKSPELSGMGTTVVATVVTESVAVVAHAGDSRAYLISDRLRQLTRDHSVVQSLVESGKLTAEEARVHPRKNVITRALGTEEEVLPDCGIFTVEPGNSLLLCSDGLTNFVDPQAIYDTFCQNQTPLVAERLVAMANENGGGDNITAVTVSL